MNIEQAILEKIRQLPLEKQQKILDFTTLLQQENKLSYPATNLTPIQRSVNWLNWVRSHKTNNQPLPEIALHRDTMYD